MLLQATIKMLILNTIANKLNINELFIINSII